MNRSRASVCLAIGVALCAPSILECRAGSSGIQQHRQHHAALSDLRKSIAGAIGPDSGDVELSATATQFNATLVNGRLNEGGRSHREGVAFMIASILANAIMNRSEFRNVAVIHVKYVSRPTGGGNLRILDAIEYRKDASGAFVRRTFKPLFA